MVAGGGGCLVSSLCGRFGEQRGLFWRWWEVRFSVLLVLGREMRSPGISDRIGGGSLELYRVVLGADMGRRVYDGDVVGVGRRDGSCGLWWEL